MIGACTGINWGLLAAVYLGLVLFGIGFNYLTAWVEARGYIKGYTSLFVAAGVAVTVLATGLLYPVVMLITLGAFAASGLPMIAGSIWRHMRERERLIEQLRKEAHDDAS